ncbi:MULTISPECIES: phosphopantetheine-binding protein [unclassified Streptomyces]|uniref:acyl carrier protein n=1 Tax=unclassified Streptomyces TaxID=2593676 RepID=UPI0036EAB80F
MQHAHPTPHLANVVKKVVASASEPPVDPQGLADDEPLNGERLHINSLTLISLLVQVEEETGLALSDELFVGRSFTTVADITAIVAQSSEAAA